MTPEDLRIEALRQAASDEKHYVGGSALFAGTGAPSTVAIVARAKIYLAFLTHGVNPKKRATRK